MRSISHAWKRHVEFDPTLLRTWAERLCLTTSDDLVEIARALGIEGRVVGQGTATVDPPPTGATRLTVVGHPIGFVYLEVSLSSRALTRAKLDAQFGEGRSMPRIHPYNDHRVAYHVEAPGAPFTCELFASFDREPTGAVAAHAVLLRRDRAPLAENKED